MFNLLNTAVILIYAPSLERGWIRSEMNGFVNSWHLLRELPPFLLLYHGLVRHILSSTSSLRVLLGRRGWEPLMCTRACVWLARQKLAPRRACILWGWSFLIKKKSHLWASSPLDDVSFTKSRLSVTAIHVNSPPTARAINSQKDGEEIKWLRAVKR